MVSLIRSPQTLPTTRGSDRDARPSPNDSVYPNAPGRGWSMIAVVPYQIGLPFSPFHSTAGRAFRLSNAFEAGAVTGSCGHPRRADTTGQLGARLAHYL